MRNILTTQNVYPPSRRPALPKNSKANEGIPKPASSKSIKNSGNRSDYWAKE